MISNKNEKIITDIIDVEWSMFSTVNASEKSPCQEQEKTFRLMRWMSYSVCDEKVLEAILANVLEAKKKGRNLMTEKYGMMEGKIPLQNIHPITEKILTKEAEMMKEVAEKYPLTFQTKSEQFGNYAACEYATYSDDSLYLYHEMIERYESEKVNIVEERYNNLFKKLGYDSLADKESQEKAKEFWENNTCRGC